MSWRAPEACPATRFVEALGRHLAASEVTAVAVDVVVEVDDDTWRLEAVLDGGAEAEPRSFTGKSCAAITDAAALATAIAVDPIHTVELEPPPRIAIDIPPPAAATDAAPPSDAPLAPIGPVSTPVPTARRVTPPAAAVAPIGPREAKPRRIHGIVRIAGAVDGGALPGFGAGPAAAVGVERRRLRIELVGGWRAPTTAHAAGVPGIGARIDLAYAGLRLCGLPSPARAITLPICGGLDSGLLRGRGVGLVADRVSRLWWNAAIVSSGVTWWVGRRVGLMLRAELGVPLRRHAFAIRGLDTVDEVAWVLGRGLVGLEVRV